MSNLDALANILFRLNALKPRVDAHDLQLDAIARAVDHSMALHGKAAKASAISLANVQNIMRRIERIEQELGISPGVGENGDGTGSQEEKEEAARRP